MSGPRGEAAVPAAGALVVGFDGRPENVAVLRAAALIAARAGDRMHVVHAVTLRDYGIDPDTEAFETDRDARLAQYRTAAAQTLTPTGLDWAYHEPAGDPTRHLIETADRIDAWAIVVAADHGGLWHHLVDGHVVTRLTREQRRPVIVIPTGPRR